MENKLLSDSFVNPGKIQTKKPRSWTWNKKRPDTPMVNEALRPEWKRNRSSYSECSNSSCQNSANVLSGRELEDKIVVNNSSNVVTDSIGEGQLSRISISEDTKTDTAQREECSTINNGFRKIRNFRWCKKRMDTPMISEEQKFYWFRTHSSDSCSSNTSISNSDYAFNDDQLIESPNFENNFSSTSSKGVFLKPLDKKFPNQHSKTHQTFDPAFLQ